MKEKEEKEKADFSSWRASLSSVLSKFAAD
jgi:hypothetical protein